MHEEKQGMKRANKVRAGAEEGAEPRAQANEARGRGEETGKRKERLDKRAWPALSISVALSAQPTGPVGARILAPCFVILMW
ncbi:uncharacterized protein SPSK_08204 [Sporothrix schenckii 1099-18]|uniref:Uncharacterized protein n=1 Tax=Sporothrix schenckii 1099-18 TaxID=1397361 RepID=A0A0F2MH13_SPOSC|nr:uncharacterized protein SPSK_08204 [Sporothrix schenckii 1099-18]KJR88145.1 hypothetical protein SPSK_08204 [Sporothrix schenckii 1099-18]